MNPFQYMMTSRHLKQVKDLQGKARNFGTERVMNQPTAPTGLYGANKSVVNKSEYETINRILDNNDAVRTATKTLNTNLYNSRNKHFIDKSTKK